MKEEKKRDEEEKRADEYKKGDRNSYILLAAIAGFAIGLLLDHPAIGMLIGVIIGKLYYDSRNK